MHLVICLRDLRQAANLTQAELAERSGVEMKTISSFETGARINSMKISQLNKIVNACGLTLHEFLLQFTAPDEAAAPSAHHRFPRHAGSADDYVRKLVWLLCEAEFDGHHPLDLTFRALGERASQTKCGVA